MYCEGVSAHRAKARRGVMGGSESAVPIASPPLPAPRHGNTTRREDSGSRGRGVPRRENPGTPWEPVPSATPASARSRC
jgi:hypothetical protein